MAESDAESRIIGNEQSFENSVKDGVESSKSSNLKKKSLTKVRSTMKITDLTIDCLEEIFDYLDLQDLLNAADANKRLNRAAQFVFLRKHENKLVRIYDRSEYIRHGGKYIHIGDISICQRFFRCFGGTFSDLEICFDTGCQSTEVFHLLHEYCSQSINKLHIQGHDRLVIMDFHKSFPKIETMILSHCVLGKQLNHIEENFPKIRRLELIQSKTSEFIESNIPQLEYLKCGIEVKNIFYGFRREQIESMVCMNPSLTHVEFNHCWNSKFLEHLSDHLPQLHKLHISDAGHFPHEDGYAHFKSVRVLELRFLSVDIFPAVDVTFDELNEFTINDIRPNDLLDFVGKNQTINKLSIGFNWQSIKINKRDLLQAAKMLPKLTSLTAILTDTFSVDDVIQFLAELKQLHTFSFDIHGSFQIEDLLTRIDNYWQADKKSTFHVTLNRSR